MITDTFTDTQAVVGITGYTKLTPNDEDELEYAVRKYGPVSVSVDAAIWHLYESGVFDGCDMQKSVDIDHAVIVDGFGIDGATGLEYWLVRNSWGFGYGEDGYIRILRKAAKPTGSDSSYPMCGIDKTPKDGNGCASEGDAGVTVCGMCGILSDSFVPVGAYLTEQ